MILICPVTIVPEVDAPFAGVAPVNAIVDVVLSIVSVLLTVPEALFARSITVPEYK
jgi:hypothetical protein